MSVVQIIRVPIRKFFDEFYNPVYKRSLAQIITPLCGNDANVLDVGCGDGAVAEMMMCLNPSLNIVGIDMQSHRPARIPWVFYGGTILPYPDDTFDVVMALDVLHHVLDIPELLAEIGRVSRRTVIIKDHAMYGTLSRYLISFTDYISNWPYDVPCAFNYPTFREWDLFFEQAKLEIREQPQRLHFGFGITEKYNPVFKLSKKP